MKTTQHRLTRKEQFTDYEIANHPLRGLFRLIRLHHRPRLLAWVARSLTRRVQRKQARYERFTAFKRILEAINNPDHETDSERA